MKLRALDLSAKELLSREQMKMILGGSGSASGDAGCINSCDGNCVITESNGMQYSGTCIFHETGSDCWCHVS